MKSAMSSSSSGSERASVSGVASGSAYDLEETKSKTTNSRMSCASDDSCAINELLEGRMDLSVTLPNSANPVVINVERRTPMLDLLVNISTQYRFTAANYTINAGDHEFKASTPIGTLDVNQISIIPKNPKSGSSKGTTPSAIPFQTTFRLQVNLPRNQLMVMRVTPNATIAAIKQIICSEKGLDSNKYQLVRFVGKSEGPQMLESNKTLAFYTINEVTLVSNKSLAQIEREYGNPSASDVNISQTSGDKEFRKSMNSLIISQSNPDLSTIDEKTVLNHTNSKQLKKRPAPPPPKPSSATLPNKSFSVEISSNKEENHSNNSSDSLKNDSNLKYEEKVSQTPQNIVDSKPILKIQKNITHVRQNSGSDSSGYHESVLSSDSPESSSATTLPKSGSMTDTITPNNTKQTNNVLNQKSVAKKRRAPPPPPTINSTQESGEQPINGDNHNTNDGIDESKVVLECMSDVSLPLSTSSSSSGTASDINNRSLSPIVITQTNGSSTPLQTTVNYNKNSLDSESSKCSSNSVKTIDNQRNEFNEMSLICDKNNDPNELKPQNEESKQSNESDIRVDSDEVDRQVTQDRTDVTEAEVCSKADNLDKNDSKESDPKTNTKESDPKTNTKSRESLPNPEIGCTAPALAISHDTELCGHDCSEQVVERNINNKVDKEMPGLSHMPVICDRIQLNNSQNNSRALIQSIAKNRLHSNYANHCTNNKSTSGLSDSGHRFSDFRSYLDDIRRTYLHEMTGDGQLKLLLTEKENQMSDKTCKQINVIDIDPTLTNKIESDLEVMGITLPPPSPFQNRHNQENSICSEECRDEGHDIVSSAPDSQTMTAALSHENDQTISNSDNSVTTEKSIQSTIETKQSNDSNETYIESQKTTSSTHITVSPNVSEEESFNKEIEVTLQSLNEELDRLDFSDPYEPIEETKGEEINRDLNFENQKIVESKSINVFNEFKLSDVETIRNKFERNSNQSKTPSPTPRVMSTLKDSTEEKKTDLKKEFPITTNGKTTLFINDSQTSRPLSPPSTSSSPSPSYEEKLAITEEVRQLCRPRVRLTNFSIGSFKKEVDIFEDTPMTAPVKSSAKSYVTFPSVKKEDKGRHTLSQSKSKVEITSNSMTATTTTTSKPSSPVIQTLVTSAPKISRIQSWSGHKTVHFQEKNIKEPIKTTERYVSQIAITKEPKKSDKPSNEERDDLRSPHLVVQSLSTKIEEEIKGRSEGRSPSPKESLQKMDSNEKKITISIKPGLESVIRSNPKQNNSLNINNAINDTKSVRQNGEQRVTKTFNVLQMKSNKIDETLPTTTGSVPSPVPPPVPPPIPPPAPQSIASFATNNLPKIFHTKGWNSERVSRSGEVPKVKHVEPPTPVNVRDQLLNEIKSFGGKNSLKKISNNNSWKLEVNTVKT